MPDNDEWANLLKDHPIFSLPKLTKSPKSKNPLELSTNTLPDFTKVESNGNLPSPSGRRNLMILKDADIIVGAGNEIRMSSFADLKLSPSARKTYKTLYTPNIQFDIHQISLNPTGKLLAVAGAFQVAVIVLPRSGYGRLVPDAVDCKYVQVGQFYHAAQSSPPIAKIDWHPWGEAGSTLLVMTVDGKLREYDMSVDTEDPQQTLHFVADKKMNSFLADDDTEREVSSFTLGKGCADWGPLTIYALMKSGDIYSICPYLPKNASVPSSYIHSLECFISAKQEFLSQATSSASKNLSVIYDYQHKYVTALVKQLPPGTIFPSSSRRVSLHPPTTIKLPPLRQGPFLLQPSPIILQDSEGGDATDIAYLAFRTDNDQVDEDEVEPEHIGAILVSYQDGKVDLLLDVEKVEARWDHKHDSSKDLPMFAVYESIDLGLVKTLRESSADASSNSLLELLCGNHPIFLLDPLQTDMVYVSHAFGVHALDISPILESLSAAFQEETEDEELLKGSLGKNVMTNVRPLLNTFSVERKCSNPVIGVTIPNDVYLSYSILILTSVMRITSLPLKMHSDPVKAKSQLPEDENSAQTSKSKWLTPVDAPIPYTCVLHDDPYKPPSIILDTSGLPTNPVHSLPAGTNSKEFVLTPDTLRFIGKTVAQIGSQINELKLAYRAAASRTGLQKKELDRQIDLCKVMEERMEKLKGPIRKNSDVAFSNFQKEQKALMARLDRLLQALMKQASPELSEQETKWFEELRRMREEVRGSGRYDDESLVARTKLLEREYERILPPLRALLAKEQQRGKEHTDAARNLGFSQAFEYGERSNVDRTRINLVEKELIKLAGKLDLELAQPPASKSSPS